MRRLDAPEITSDLSLATRDAGLVGALVDLGRLRGTLAPRRLLRVRVVGRAIWRWRLARELLLRKSRDVGLCALVGVHGGGVRVWMRWVETGIDGRGG